MGATLFFAGRFFCALMMTLAVSVSYDHREQEQTIFSGMFPFRFRSFFVIFHLGYHRIEHIEEQYDGPSMIFLLAVLQPYEVVQIVCTRHYIIRTAQSNLQFVFLFWRGSFVMRMVDNTIAAPDRDFLGIFLDISQLSPYARPPSLHRIFRLVYPPAIPPAYSEWCNRPPLLHRPFRVVYPPTTPPHIQSGSGVIARHFSTAHSEWYIPPTTPPHIQIGIPARHPSRIFRVVYPPAIPPLHIQSGVIARHSSTAHSEWYTRPPSLHRIFRVV
ncbi:hypothetical protein T02_10238 [Trichinella nativa]|uniref:Secreted protein n=1 Tax=Trichinella nativa TaxID=6335 RepID=A0A0V1LRR9_9BILA|nr:hypothetical protein T02_10238 [Trichinella nativa]